MPRKPMVTRTMTVSDFDVLITDVAAGDTYHEQITLPRTYKDDAAALKAVRKYLETDQLKPTSICNTSVVSRQYGMTEKEFIDAAAVLSGQDPEPEEAEDDTPEPTPAQKPKHKNIKKKKIRKKRR